MKKIVRRIKDVLKENLGLYIKQFDENVLINRRCIHLPIHVVLFWDKQKLAFHFQNKDTSSKELLEHSIAVCPLVIQEHYKTISSIFVSNSKTIQNDLIK